MGVESESWHICFRIKLCRWFSWIVDSRATNHICPSLQALRKTRELRDGELTFLDVNGEFISAKVVGEVRLVFNNKFMILNNVYYVSNILRNIISISQLCEQLFTISFNNNRIVIYRNSMKICSACLKNWLYILYPHKSFHFNT